MRDGAQAQGISYSVEDKLKIVARLDALGVAYIEAGNPGSNPKDLEFFARAGALKLRHARLIAFGATRKVGKRVADDANVKSLLKAGTPAIAIFGKSWDYQVLEILRTTLEENLAMIGESASVLSHEIRTPITTLRQALRAVGDLVPATRAVGHDDGVGSRFDELRELSLGRLGPGAALRRAGGLAERRRPPRRPGGARGDRGAGAGEWAVAVGLQQGEGCRHCRHAEQRYRPVNHPGRCRAHCFAGKTAPWQRLAPRGFTPG